MIVQIIPALTDNYIYLIHDPKTGVTGAVDPSEVDPVLKALKERNWKLDFVLNTHHHWDHTGGNLKLKQETGCKIICSKADANRIEGADEYFWDQDVFKFGSTSVKIIETFGHTLGAICYWFFEDDLLFTGDTLFSLGCGRLFEGTPELMWQSMQKIRALPPSTKIYCGHEYTEQNSRFALHLDPENPDLQKRTEEVKKLRSAGKPTLPVTLETECLTNPFLRTNNPQTFAQIRKQKDGFK